MPAQPASLPLREGARGGSNPDPALVAAYVGQTPPVVSLGRADASATTPLPPREGARGGSRLAPADIAECAGATAEDGVLDGLEGSPADYERPDPPEYDTSYDPTPTTATATEPPRAEAGWVDAPHEVRERARNDPLVRKVMDLFDGLLVRVQTRVISPSGTETE